ncbi:MAG: hypothetical protein R8L58_02975 [Mariprofundaceae bacterium]
MIVLLAAALAAIAVKFVVLGSTAPADDGRTGVLLESGERDLVLSEMRQLLAATQQISEGLADADMQQIVEAATAVGMQATSTMDVRLKARLPLAFKQLGFATHQAFDDIASMARERAEPRAIQKKLAQTMNNCLACHAAYQIPMQRK